MNKVTKQDLIAEFHRLADELGKKPTLGEFEDGEYSSTPVYKRFESYEELKDAAGYETGEHRISKETLLEDLRRVADEVGRSPPVEVYDEHGNHNSKTLKDRFGNWHDTLEAAGLEPTDHSQHWDGVEQERYSKEGDVEVDCSYCGDTTSKTELQLERFQNAYCSPECQYAALSEETGEDARAWNGGKVEIECESCGDAKEVKPAEVDNARFCSQECMLEWRADHLSGDNHPRWEGGYNRYYGPNWRKQRRKARRRDNHTCQLCEMDRETHNQIWDCDPVVHHIVRFGDFDDYREANQLDNLVTLCKECHGLVEGGRKELPESAKDRI